MRPIKWCTYLPIRPFIISALTLLCLFMAACKEDPEKAKVRHMERGKQYLEQKLYAEARIEFRNALLIDKKLVAAYYGLGEANLGLANLQEAFDAFKQAVELDENHLDARVQLGNIYLQYVRDDKEASRLADEVLQKDPHHIEGHILRASVRLARKQWEEAEAELKRALELNPQRLETHLSLARYYDQRSKAQTSQAEVEGFKREAERIFRQAVEMHPRSSLARLAFGDFLYSTGKAAEAEEQLRQADELAPRDKLVLTALQRFYETQLRFEEAEKYLVRLAELNPDKNAGRASLYDLHARAGKLDQAIGEYQQLLKENPKYIRGYSRLAELLLEKNDLDGAARQIEEALKLNRQDTDALLVRGRLHTLKGNYEAAIPDLEQVLKQEPTLPAALYYLADAHLQNNDPERARAYVNSLLNYYPQSPAGLLMLIRILLNQGKASEAVQIADQIINGIAFLKANAAAFQASRLTPEMLPDLESKGYVSRAVARIQLQDLRGAEVDLIRAAQIDPPSPEPHSNLAMLYLLRNDLNSARREAELALQLAPNNPVALSTAITVYIQQKEFAAAHTRLDTLLASRPDDAVLLDQKVRVFSAQNDLAKTEQTLRRIVEVAPNYLNAYFELSAFYHNQKQTDRAIAQLQEVINRRPSNRLQVAQAHVLTGMLEEARGRYEEAVRNYEKSLHFDTRSVSAAIAYNNLAWLIADRGLGNLDKAADYARNAIGILPEASFYDTLGYVFHKKQLYSVAIEQFNKAIEKRPLNPTYHFHLARVLRDNKELQKARQAYERAIKLGGADFAEADLAKQELAALR